MLTPKLTGVKTQISGLYEGFTVFTDGKEVKKC